jgi:hypothetical protein
LNRIQVSVAAFLVVVWAVLLVIQVVDPPIYNRLLRLRPGANDTEHATFLAVMTLLFAVLLVGVVRRWSWTFWLILGVFAAGVLRVPVAWLQLSRALPSRDPDWYIMAQLVLGVAQVIIGITMVFGYRGGGVWGASPRES